MKIKSKIDRIVPIEKKIVRFEITKQAKVILIIISQFFISNLSKRAKQLEIKYKKRARRASNNNKGK